MRRGFLVFVLALIVSSCGSNKQIVTKRNAKTERVVKEVVEHVVKKMIEDGNKPEGNDDSTGTPPVIVGSSDEDNQNTIPTVINTPEDYIAVFNGIAKFEMREHGVPASITLAQGILESGSGKGRLAKEGNNHFGIKCHGWTGEKIYHDDDASQECFRKYTDAKYSFEDHSLFLTGRSRYSKLFRLKKDDYKGWAKGLRAAGYATDTKYPEKLISIIERYQLDKYDAEVLGNSTNRPTTTVAGNNSSSNTQHIVQQGDTLYSLSRKFNVSVKDLQELNGLESNNLSIGQTLLIK